jgi:transposase-like protein
MLVELSVVEQRYPAVREALDTGATITDIATRYGVDRRTVHRWLDMILRNVQATGLEGRFAAT